MLARSGDLRVVIEVPYRDITCGEQSFHDDRLEVMDYDAATDHFYRVIDLDDPRVAMQQGVDPSESDPQFHQQMVYAVASRVLENFDRALGRRLRFWGGQRLRLFPHAFQGRNAFYDDGLNAVLFGYFLADEDDPGPNLPGQYVFTSLSHDIIAHEVAHAALDRLHRHYREPTSPQVPALHEAFADVVAIFQRFTFAGVVREVVRATRGDLSRPNPLVEVGAQFGAAAGLRGALRTVSGPPDPEAFTRANEPHALGLILVSAIFDGFVRTYERRTADLVRIATGGSGRLPDGELHPDLVNRLAAECARTAQSVLSMCIRATDYLPPVDPSFSDFLRGMLTADFELNRADEIGLRAAMIEAFRLRGIRPEAVGSLAVESLLLEPIDSAPDPRLADIVSRLLSVGAREMSRNTAAPSPPPEGIRRRVKRASSSSDRGTLLHWEPDPELLDAVEGTSEADEVRLLQESEPDETWRSIARDLSLWARAKNDLRELGFDEGRIRLDGFHPVHRSAPSGELLVEMVAQFVQSRPLGDELGGLKYRAGVTMVATLDGRVHYLIRKPFHQARENAMREWVKAFDASRGPAWPTGTRPPQRIAEAFSARAMDGRRWR